MIELLSRVGDAVEREGVWKYLLVPQLGQREVEPEVYQPIVLAALWRLRRGRPYIIAGIDVEMARWTYRPDDRAYVSDLLERSTSPIRSGIAVVEVGFDDPSPLLPTDEQEFLLCLPDRPTLPLPRWPELVVSLNGVLISQSDEFVTVQTADGDLRRLLDSLPLWSEPDEPRKVLWRRPTHEGR